MTASLILWGHALAALLFGGLAVRLARRNDGGLPRGSLIAALVLTALWALAVAGIDARDVTARVMESARNIAWLAFLWALLRRDGGAGLAIGATIGVAMTICALTAVLAFVDPATYAADLAAARAVLRMIVAVTGLVLLHHLALAPDAGGGARGGVRLALAALAAMWSVDFLLFATAWVAAAWPGTLVALRGGTMAGVAILLAIAVHRGGDWTLKPSRAVAIRSLSLGAVAVYVAAMALATGLFSDLGGLPARVLQTAFVAGGTATLIGLLASPWLRAWIKVKVAKHLFDHRYDYRREWLRFTDTLARPDAETPLDARVVMAIANLTDSPGGLLLAAGDGGLSAGHGWNWSGASGGGALPLAAHLAAGERVLDLDRLRADGRDERAPVPDWLLAHPDAWALVPLVHAGRLAGAVVLARPPFARALDWEDFDLLRVAGRQGASYLAEARAAAALAEAQRFDEFNRRFAFIIHDVKNLVSQLTLVARNAERHADNPAFRADMVATLRDSCGRMSALLQRLSQHSGGRADPPRPTDVFAVIERIARQRRDQHPLEVTGGPALAQVDPMRFEQIVSHLVQNAVEASPADAPVTITVETTPADVTVAVVDRGCGMTGAFVRDELFRPFASSKVGGFGIGAFEARQLAEAMHGRVTVDSAPGAGTRFAVSFPRARSLELAA